MGSQEESDAYDGFGLDIRGKHALIENCFVLNATAEAIKLITADNTNVNYCMVYSDNKKNPTDYYYIIAGGTKYATVNSCYAERAIGLSHGGHGFNIKNEASYNTFKNCIAKRTNFELTYSGVQYNTIDGGGISGDDKSGGEWALPSEWPATLSIIGAANNNTIKNFHIENTYAAIVWNIFNDTTGKEANLSHDNNFENITVQNVRTILQVGGGTNFVAEAKNNTFTNCHFTEFQAVARTYFKTENIKFENCNFKNGEHLMYEAGGDYAPYSKFNVTWQNCSWENMGFPAPK